MQWNLGFAYITHPMNYAHSLSFVVVEYYILQSHSPAWTIMWFIRVRGHNECNGISNHLCLQCLPKCLFRRRSKKTSKLRITALFERNPPVMGGFPHKGPVMQRMFPFDDIIMCYSASEATVKHICELIIRTNNVSLYNTAKQNGRKSLCTCYRIYCPVKQYLEPAYHKRQHV